jgi:hypothetical protein
MSTKFVKPPEFASAEAFVKGAVTPHGGRRPPPDDTRLTCNISTVLHTQLKIYAVKRKITVGELIEEWIIERTPKV